MSLPIIRCVVHAADSSTKHMTNSQTKNITQLLKILLYLKAIMHYLQLSIKSTGLMNEILGQMDIRSIHMVAFCPARLSYILPTSTQTLKNSILVSPWDVLVTVIIKKGAEGLF